MVEHQFYKGEGEGLGDLFCGGLFQHEGGEGEEESVASVFVDCFESGAGIDKGTSLARVTGVGRFVFFLLHNGIDGFCNFAEFLGLVEGGGSYKISMQEHSEVVDRLFEVAI